MSQQIKALERSLGVTLLRRSSRHVELTPEGEVFLRDCRRVLGAADRAVGRVRAASRGEAGTLRIVYTFVTASDTVPRLLGRLAEVHPQLKVSAREVYGADVPTLLRSEQCDLALAPMTSHPRGFHAQAVRREALRLAVSLTDPLAALTEVELSAVSDRRFEVWPPEMSPGYHDSVVGACRAAGFEPRLDERGSGNTVWTYLAQGRGVGLVTDSLRAQQPVGVTLIPIVPAPAPMTIEAVWRRRDLAIIGRALGVARELGSERDWL